LGQPVTLAAAQRNEIEPQAWLASPVSEPLRAQWLGRLGENHVSVVLLRGAEAADTRAALAALKLDGVAWVDKVGEVSQLLGRYRQLMSAVLVLGFALTWAALAWRFGRASWRALAPTALASVLTVALLAICGQVLQLFHILPLLILLGLGVDYGIFLLEQPGRAETRPFLSVTLAAASTLLSFGLLALSSTPALQAFGLTLLIGVFLAWFLTPFFMPHA
ncbi:MAG TPA: MMPL family transporter, partial [Roseateles sp.]